MVEPASPVPPVPGVGDEPGVGLQLVRVAVHHGGQVVVAAALGAEPVGSSVADFQAYLARQREFTSALIREAGITAD